MALRRINSWKKHLLLVLRPFSSSSSSNPPFPPPPPPSNDPNASSHPPLLSGPEPPRDPQPGVLALPDHPRAPKVFPHAAPSAPDPGQPAPSLRARHAPVLLPRHPPHDQVLLPLLSLRPRVGPLPHRRYPSFQDLLGGSATQAEGLGKEEDSGIALAWDYSYEELGKRLGELRPAGVGKDGKEWFSFEELQGRIAKLAELEKEDPWFRSWELRKSILNIHKTQDKKNKTKTMEGMSTLANIGGGDCYSVCHRRSRWRDISIRTTYRR